MLMYFFSVDGGNDNIGRHDHLRRLWEFFAFPGPKLFFAGYAPHRSWDTRVHNSFYGMLRRTSGKHLHGSCSKWHVNLLKQVKRTLFLFFPWNIIVYRKENFTEYFCNIPLSFLLCIKLFPTRCKHSSLVHYFIFSKFFSFTRSRHEF